MKEYLVAFIALFLLLLAPSIEADFKIDGSEVSFGNSGYEKQKDPIEKNIVVKNDNTGYDNITDLTYVFTIKDSKYNIKESDLKVNLPDPKVIETSKSIKLELTIDNFDAVDEDLEEQGKIEIGSLVIKGKGNGTTDIQTNSIPLKLEIENDLEIDSIKLITEDDTISIGEDKEYKVTEDEDLTLKLKISNRFSDGGLSIEGIKITVTSEDIDLDKDTTISEIEADNDEEVEIDFSLDTIDSDEVLVEIEGEDELGGRHGVTFEFNLEVEEAEEPEPGPDEDDSDGDGVKDALDLCPNTISACSVDKDGCPIDSDDDGVCDDLDPTPKPDNKEEEKETKNSTTKSNQQNKKEETEEETEPNGETEGLIPFLIGLFIGIVLSAGFFTLVKPSSPY